ALGAVQAGRATVAAAAELLKRLGPGTAPALVDGIGAMDAGAPRQELARLLLFFGDAGLLAACERLGALPEGPALELLAQAGRVQSPSAIDLFDLAMAHPAQAVRADGQRRAAEPSQMSPG